MPQEMEVKSDPGLPQICRNNKNLTSYHALDLLGGKSSLIIRNFNFKYINSQIIL